MEKVNLIKAMAMIEDDRKISKDIITESLKEAMAKAYKKNVELPDINVRVDIVGNGKFKIYQQYTVVEEVFDDELEISLEDAQDIKFDAQLGDVVEQEVKADINSFSRAAASLAKSVVKQKIREAEKQAIYDEFIDKVDEMVKGTVETVEDKFTLINLGKTIAILPKSQQIPTERLFEGQLVSVVIKEVNRETKKSQVTVSRNDPTLVRRLFEKEVDEVYSGVVEIKAIARDAGERCKIAVKSHDENVDPIGACIGPHGSRVQEIIKELNGEKIDIFEWNDDITSLVKNALAPASVKAVVSQSDKSVLVVVDDDQLSLAIGRKGKNARLAVKLINKKIDIKTESDLAENGITLAELLLEQEAQQKANKELDEVVKELFEEEAEEVLVEETNTNDEFVEVEETVQVEDTKEVVEETPEVEEVEVQETTTETQEVSEEESEEKTKKRKVKLEKKADEYVSKFEKLADSSKRSEKTEPKRRRKKDDDDRKLRAKDILNNLDIEYDNRPVYSEEELEEIRLREEEEMNQYDVDYDAFEEYYDED